MIRVENLYHSYSNDDKYAVENISFNIEKGEIFGFLGPSGAGKSTCQNILTGLLPLQRGNVIVGDYDLKKENKKRFNEIGVSFEQANLYSKLSALENLSYYAKLFDVPTRDPYELIKMVGLEGKEKQKAGEFSKGMKHRLSFARSLINNPKIWFLDEPTTGLDPKISAKIKKIIKEENSKGVTCFLTTHNMSIADELCDRVAFIVDGKIALIDSPKTLKLKYGQKIIEVEYIDKSINDSNANPNTPIIKRLKSEIEEDRKTLKEIIDTKNILTMHSKEASLEEIFIEITGRELDSSNED